MSIWFKGFKPFESNGLQTGNPPLSIVHLPIIFFYWFRVSQSKSGGLKQLICFLIGRFSPFRFKCKMLRNKSTVRHLIEFIVLVALIVGAELLPDLLHNTQPVFFCRDPNLSYPLRKQTFTIPQLYLIAFIVPSVVVSACFSTNC